MYVNKANIFILLTSANYGPIYLIDFTKYTRVNNPIFIQLSTTVFLRRPLLHNMNLVFLIIFILFVMVIKLFVFNIRCCHIPFIYGLVKFVQYLWKLNLK